MINRLERDQVSNQPIKTLYELRHLNMGNRSMRTLLYPLLALGLFGNALYAIGASN
jgi:hypothetical protein